MHPAFHRRSTKEQLQKLVDRWAKTLRKAEKNAARHHSDSYTADYWHGIISGLQSAMTDVREVIDADKEDDDQALKSSSS